MVRVGDIDVAYRVLGNGEPLVMIMGYAGTMDIWDPTLLQELAGRYMVIIFDNRGMGGTSAPPGEFSIEQFADDTAGLIAALGLERANVLGYSMGTSVAEELALRHPERVQKMILLSADCGPPDSVPADSAVWQQFRAALATSGTVAEVRLRVSAVLVPPVWLARNLAYMTRVVSVPLEPVLPENVARQDRAMASWRGACTRLGQIAAPTPIVAGTADVLTPPANGQVLAERIPGSWLVRIADGGHGLMYQFPKQLARVVEVFIGASN
jgi:pimeloyl-ACP methyl ester carboxylesterase